MQRAAAERGVPEAQPVPAVLRSSCADQVVAYTESDVSSSEPQVTFSIWSDILS